MISILNRNNQLNEEKNCLSITYPRTVNIIFGNYPYPDVIHNLMIAIKQNLNSDMENYTNVKGGMTDWNYFLDKPDFVNFISFLINKHQVNHPHLFNHFLERRNVENAWGNEIKKGDSLNYHTHHCLHGILYLTKGCDLILPELNIKIKPEPGDYYIFPPEILHGFNISKEKESRYSLIFNIVEKDGFKYDRKKTNARQNS